ncbi:uncharacterized protein FSUBG_253 [Fusarium subglutinans]|uniref:Uncharacterized protein n=1 Tax=Gibberella subglutinans TaxID=42677 RepID=A0A8H5V9P3_GIBSU|nr:uncharacterized protein FSUBG_253 [Fusarium subglutinans]KAF5614373.1 hypothetical protein FSUBG_253 [Fusarium subglutinans]
MATENGFLVPPNFKEEPPSDDDMNFASIIWGLSLGVTIFNCGKAMRQTQAAIRRRNRLTLYIIYIWLEVCSSTVLGIMVWLYLRGIIKPSFQYYFFIIVFWSIQVQCLIQIIINRVSLLMVVRRNGTILKWTCFGILLSINISVFCIWIPARLQISEKYIHVNEIWDRMEKVLFAIMDAALNFYFIWVVKQRLVANGLQKYTRLYHMNMVLVAISIALDILLIGMMSLPNSFVYVQFHPLVYLCKLHIEMNMADLIGKVVRAGNNQADGTHDYSSRSRTTVKTGARPAGASRFGGGLTRTHIELGEEDEIELKHRENLDGIKKTIVTEVVRSPNSEDDEITEHHERAVSEASSTNARHEPYSIEHAK